MKKNQTIMVVDDEPVNIYLLERILEIEGYSVITAKSGMETLKSLEINKPDLILLDIMMPGINGIEVLEKIKSNSNTSLIPVIMITASTNSRLMKESLSLGASAFFTKPFIQDEIIEIIDKIITEKHVNICH